MISKKALDEFKAIWKKEFGEEISDAFALDSATKLLTLTDIVYRQIEKEHDDISFEHEEDKKFFADLLAGGDKKKLANHFFECFDRRSPEVKRQEFNFLRKKLLPILLKRDGNCCQLKFEGCEHDKNLVVDHIIPLSSNKLNRKIRGQKTVNGKKPKSQSFGSNNLQNLLIACEHCNSYKKHRFLNPVTRELI